MPKKVDNTQVLTELCFLYLTCSHALDDDMSDAELEMIVKRMRAWTGDKALVDPVLERSLSLYTKVPGRVERLKTAARCAHKLRDELPPDRLELVIRDLAQIVEADGKVIPQERRFVETTAMTFGVSTDGIWR